jgi:hypothetical protein
MTTLETQGSLFPQKRNQFGFHLIRKNDLCLELQFCPVVEFDTFDSQDTHRQFPFPFDDPTLAGSGSGCNSVVLNG